MVLILKQIFCLQQYDGCRSKRWKNPMQFNSSLRLHLFHFSASICFILSSISLPPSVYFCLQSLCLHLFHIVFNLFPTSVYFCLQSFCFHLFLFVFNPFASICFILSSICCLHMFLFLLQSFTSICFILSSIQLLGSGLLPLQRCNRLDDFSS